eukprot:COSAG01_NODE_1317_length_10750_cov_1.790536_14_plen_88_part_00
MAAGYLALGSLAAGIDEPSRTYPRVLMLLVPFCAAVYILPFFVSLSVSEDLTKYEAGYFSIVADTVRQNGQLLSRGGRSLPATCQRF